MWRKAYWEVTLCRPLLRSSSVQAVRMVLTSRLSSVSSFPEALSWWRANCPSWRLSWRWSGTNIWDEREGLTPGVIDWREFYNFRVII